MKEVTNSPKPTRKLTEEECLEIGGHCWEISNLVFAVFPPCFERVCKHCGKRQVGHRGPSYVWQDSS